jgi:hypothetical protein
VIGASLALLLLAQSDPNPATQSAQASIVYNRAWINDNDEPWIDAPIDRSVSANTLRLIPKINGSYQMIDLECRGVKQDGSLFRCQTHTSPINPLMSSLAMKISHDIRLERSFAQSHQHDLNVISIQIRVSNSDTVVTSGPCWPPRCSSIPLPPPPPPKSPY